MASDFTFPRAIVGQLAGRTADNNLRSDPQGGLVVQDSLGCPFYEMSRQGKIFSISNGFAGVTSAAAWITPVGAAAATLLTLYNPTGSGVNLAVIEAGLVYCSGTVEAGMYTFNVHFNTTITATANAVAKCLRPNADGAGTAACGAAKGFSNTALTGGIAGVESLPIGSVSVAGNMVVKNVWGQYILREKDALTIAAPTNGTSAVMGAWMTYAEILQAP